MPLRRRHMRPVWRWPAMLAGSICLALSCGCAPTDKEVAPPASPVEVKGWEAADGWKLAEWEDPGQVKKAMVGDPPKAVLRLASSGGPKGKSAAVLASDISLVNRRALRLTAYDAGRAPVRVAVAFWMGDGWVYHESRAQEVPVGAWKELTFDLAAADYKTAGSKWEHTVALPRREDVRQIGVLVLTNGKAAAVYFDGLTADQGPGAARDQRPGPGRRNGPPPPRREPPPGGWGRGR